MGTSLCDATETLKQQETNGNTFFLNRLHRSTRKCMFDNFTQNAHGITQRHTLLLYFKV